MTAERLNREYHPDKAELLALNIPKVEKLLGIHIDRLRQWGRWEDLVKNWLAFCESPKTYADTIVVDMVKLYYKDRWGE